jgi:hypothetical protein
MEDLYVVHNPLGNWATYLFTSKEEAEIEVKEKEGERDLWGITETPKNKIIVTTLEKHIDLVIRDEMRD